MIKAIRTILINMLTAANVLTVGLLLLSGYSDRINPVGHEWLACAGMGLPIIAVVNLLFLPLWVFICWRRLWIPLAGFALAYVPIRIYLPIHPAQTEPDNALTVLSWNVCGYGGNFKYEQAFDSVFAYATRNKADILCTQEDMGPKVKAKRYQEFFPYNDTTRVSKPGISNVNCVGIHTRFPILRKEVIDYESRLNGSVAYFLLIGKDTVIVVNNHLESTHLSTDDRKRYKEMINGGMPKDTAKAETISLIGILGQSMAKRAPHADAIHQYIESHKQYPIIVCGDFNDTPISYARHTIAKGLADCFVEAGMGAGISFNQKGFNFRIDHMMVSDHFEPVTCKIDSKTDFSDHYPLLCRMKKTNKGKP